PVFDHPPEQAGEEDAEDGEYGRQAAEQGPGRGPLAAQRSRGHRLPSRHSPAVATQYPTLVIRHMAGRIWGAAAGVAGIGCAAACWIDASAGVASRGGSSAFRAARPIDPRNAPITTNVSPVRSSPRYQNRWLGLSVSGAMVYRQTSVQTSTRAPPVMNPIASF